MAQSRDGIIWMGTEGGGVCCYDGQVVQTIHLPGDASLNVIHALSEDPEGRIWFATLAGGTLAVIFIILFLLIVADFLGVIKITELIPWLG